MVHYDDPLDFPMAGGPTSAPRKRRRRKIHTRPKSSIGSGSARSEINVTPLVDVVLVLLIIFMVVTPMLHRGVKIDLPSAAHHDSRQDTGEQLIVSVRGDGMYIETDKIGDVPEYDKDKSTLLAKDSPASVGERIKKELREGSRSVFVRADRKLKYGQVRYVLEQLHNAGAGAVSMQTEDFK